MRSLLVAGLAVLAFHSAPAFAAKPVAPSAQLATTHGYVYANFTKGNGGTLSVAPISGGKPIELVARSDEKFDAQGAWLPAGQYRLVDWRGRRFDSPPIEVQAGRITDLGGLVGVGIGGDRLVFVPTHHPENKNDVALAVQEFAGVLTNQAPLSWSPATHPTPFFVGADSTGMGLLPDLMAKDARKKAMGSLLKQLEQTPGTEAFMALVRTLTSPLSEEPAISPDGTLYFGADLGQVRIRKPDGTWSGVGMDTYQAVVAVEYDDGALVTGTDRGILRRSDDGGATWKELKVLAEQNVVDIDHDATQWLVQTNRMGEHKNPAKAPLIVAVYRATKADLSDLALVREFPLALEQRLAWAGARPSLRDGEYTLAANGLHRLDTKTMEWREISPPTRVDQYRIDEATGLMTAVRAQGVFSKVWMSADLGATWREIGRPPYAIADVQMDTPDSGWALRLNFENASNTTAWDVYRFEPSIKDWKLAGRAPHMCKPLRVSKSLPVLCMRNDASIWRLDADKWVVEFDTSGAVDSGS